MGSTYSTHGEMRMHETL